METAIKLQLYLFCLLVLAVLWRAGDRRRYSDRDLERKSYRAMLLSTALMSILDSLTWLVEGWSGPGGPKLVLVVDCLYYAMHTFPIGSFVLYAYSQLFRDAPSIKRILYPLIAIEAAMAALAIASVFQPVLFYVDAASHYHRGPFFAVFAVVQYGLIAFIIAVLIVNKGNISRRVLLTLVAYPLPALIASLFQMLYYGLTLIWPMTAVFLVIAFCNIENRRAKTDYLTGTGNRRYLDEELERRIASAKAGSLLYGILIDIDDFKLINDSFGHEMGDRALEDIAHLLLSIVRVEDHVARMGGDEFVILADLSGDAAFDRMVSRINSSVNEYNASRRRPFDISLSIGGSRYYPSKTETPAEFLSLLDADMYANKRAKKLAR
jgi:diguanylate cyclase (GGDEF)-like protein